MENVKYIFIKKVNHKVCFTSEKKLEGHIEHNIRKYFYPKTEFFLNIRRFWNNVNT